MWVYLGILTRVILTPQGHESLLRILTRVYNWSFQLGSSELVPIMVAVLTFISGIITVTAGQNLVNSFYMLEISVLYIALVCNIQFHK